MSRHLRYLLVVLTVWTVCVWTTRIVNVWGDAHATTAERLFSTGLSALLLAGAGVLVAIQLRSRRRPPSPGEGRTIRAFCGATAGIWIVRGAQIAASGRGAAFVIVHLVLAAISIALAAATWRELDRLPASVSA